MKGTPFANALHATLLTASAGLLCLSPAQAQAVRMSAGEVLNNLVVSERIVSRVVAGRIIVSCARAMDSTNQGSTQERIHIRPGPDGATIDYELKKPDEHLIVEVRAAQLVRLRRETGEGARRELVELLQKQGGRMTLTVGSAGQTKVVDAAGLWHLLVAERELCSQRLFPLLARIRKDWRFDEKLDSIEEELLRLASGAGDADRQRWTALVRQLADERFGRREAAERALRAAGPAALGFLEQLDFDRLEPEQQARIRRILRESPAEDGDDSPIMAGGTLIDSPPVWLGMLARTQPDTRRAAAAQLSKLLGAPIEFDVQADAAVRQRQIEAIRAKIAAAPPRR